MTTSAPRQQPSTSREPQHDIAGAGVGAFAVVMASLLYATAGVFWLAGGPGFPFGVQNDPQASGLSFLDGVTQSQAASWVVGLALAGAGVAVAILRWRRSRALAAALLVLAVAQAVGYALLIPDGRLLVAAAHLPVLLVGKPFGWPPGVTIASQLPWPVLHQALLVGLGMLWAVTAVTFHRRVTGACQRCGRQATAARAVDPARVARTGRWAVGIAVAIPAVYAATRLAWAFGVPLGFSQEFLTVQRQESPTIFTAGAFLAVLALAGATLTLGLVQRWGEIYPRWIPGLAGRPVRPRTAIIPATTVAVLLTEGGIGWIRAAVGGHFPDGALGPDWATVAPGMLLPLWGIALATATYAYYLRRRSPCPRCGHAVIRPGATAPHKGRVCRQPAHRHESRRSAG